MSDRLFDFMEKYFAFFFVVTLLLGIGVAVYVFQENPRCLMANDPFLCLEVSRLSE